MNDILALICTVLIIGLWGYALWHVARSSAFQHGNKLMWILLLLLLPGLGPFIYLAVGRPRGA